MRVHRLLATLALVLCFILVLSACSQQGPQITSATDKPAASGTTLAGTTQPSIDKKLEITWIGHGTFDPSINEDTEIEKLVEKKFNVDIKVVPIYNLKSEIWNTYWASGNTADFISNPGVDYRQMVEQGLVREISEDMIRKNMPKWIKKVEDLAGNPDLVKKQMYNVDGKVYTIPFCTHRSWNLA